jgi:hypothetical protein
MNRETLKRIRYLILYGLFLIFIAWWAYPLAWFYYRRKDAKTIRHDKEYEGEI